MKVKVIILSLLLGVAAVLAFLPAPMQAAGPIIKEGFLSEYRGLMTCVCPPSIPQPQCYCALIK